MNDTFKSQACSLTSPSEDAAEIVPADAGALPHATRVICVGVPNDVRTLMLSGATDTPVGVPAGSFLPPRFRQVQASGTTAADIVGFR